MNQVQAAFIGSLAGGGSGTLFFGGGVLPLQRRRLGVGGIGASTIDAVGEVYRLRRLADFPAPMPARYGFTVGTASGGDVDAERSRRG